MPDLDADGAGHGDLLGGNEFTELLAELQSGRPDEEPFDPTDPAGGQPVDDPQYDSTYDDTDPYPYGIADL